MFSDSLSVLAIFCEDEKNLSIDAGSSGGDSRRPSMVNLAIRPAPVRAVGVPTAAAMGALVVTAFCLVIAGPNLPTALLPAYRATFGMTPFGLSLIFAAYLVVLVPVLVICTRPALRARAGSLLPVGLAMAITADLLMVGSPSVAMLAIGRALSGISVAVSTGAAAALMVSLVGERGRGSVATGNIAGALLGTAAAVLLAQVGIGSTIYLVHAGVAVVVLVALIAGLLIRRAALGAGAAPAAVGPVIAGSVAVGPVAAGSAAHPSATPTRLTRRHLVLGTAVGAVGWAIPGLVTGLVPALLRDFTGPTAIVVATVPALLLLGSAWGVQVLARRPLFRWLVGYELTVGTALAALGLILLTVGAFIASLPLVYLACIVAAGGPSLGYRGGMVLLTRGLDPALHGATTSRYAASSYGFAAVVVVGAGALGAIGGMVTAVAVGAGLLALAAIVLLGFILITESPRRAARVAEGPVRVAKSSAG
jgi:hypothetical protein